MALFRHSCLNPTTGPERVQAFLFGSSGGKDRTAICRRRYECLEIVQGWLSTYNEQCQLDPIGPLAANGEDLPWVVRGGSWRDGARWVRSAFRDAYRPSVANYDLGFRICLRFIEPGQETG